MPVPQSVSNAYSQVEPLLKAVSEYVEQTLRTYCDRSGYLFFDRIKKVESLSEKLEGGRIAKWSDIDDLYACTIVIPTTLHEPGVIRKLDACFARVSMRSRGTAKKAPEVFRFDTTRYYARLSTGAAAERAPGIESITFEVQIATAFEYAWSTVTHDLVYKGDRVDWKKQRLAAQLKAAVEQIEMIIGAFDQVSGAVPESEWPEVAAKDSIVERFQELIADGVIASNLTPVSWRRFADNVFALVASYTPNNYARPSAIDALLAEFATAWRQPSAPPCPESGSLFQMVLGHVSKSNTVGSLDKYTVVNSVEMRDFYNLQNVSREFKFDGEQQNPDTEDKPS
ncbi:hypothetical protein H1V43_36510 [Streptomyces sp. PSKA54]|uniref:RelA/SpoT domain-containing protein n=1 Tax=Streptomyces himalayensis subsp. aureolus TaxID=2758039 RepID=A0A7W2D8Q7_9ACTN|nr:hypothetical protein [Streptomyces himalayensis]MBA4866708.1 hypothetical protein [Streptomyces himalayensis subsp. aureolus]